MLSRIVAFFIVLLAGIAATRHVRLVLHFDLNKTVIMLDRGMNLSVRATLNSILSDSACGTIDSSGSWRWDGERPPVWNSCGRGKHARGHDRVTYAAHLSLSGMDRLTRRQYIQKFTQPGEPGEGLGALLNTLQSNLTLSAAPSESESRYMLLVPAFFELMLHLQRQQIPFSLAFRTFGEDLDEVAREWNAFCEGHHPRYPGVYMDGTQGGEDHRLHQANLRNVVHRDATGMFLVSGTGELPPGSREWGAKRPTRQQCEVAARCEAAADPRNGREFYAKQAGLQIHSTHEEVHSYFSKLAARGTSIGVVEDWAWWHRSGENSTQGKPLIIDTADKTRHTIYVDDNVRAQDAYVVDVRDTHGRPMPFSQTQGYHVLSSSPVQAIMDPNYFVTSIAECHSQWTLRRNSG